jgi:hypothetical protein
MQFSITESGEDPNLAGLVREPLPPAFHRLAWARVMQSKQ